MTPYQYSDEQIFIRAMPCPKCGAAPREHCYRKREQNGMIKNHQERMWEWHKFVKQQEPKPRPHQKRKFKGSDKLYLSLIDDDDKFS